MAMAYHGVARHDRAYTVVTVISQPYGDRKRLWGVRTPKPLNQLIKNWRG